MPRALETVSCGDTDFDFLFILCITTQINTFLVLFVFVGGRSREGS